MEWPAAVELMRYWHQFPPAHLLLRFYTGYQPAEPAATPMTDQAIAELVTLANGR